VETEVDIWDFSKGFLDGSVYDKSANLTACASYAQAVTTTYYYNWFYLFEDDEIIKTNFNEQNQEASVRLIFQYI